MFEDDVHAVIFRAKSLGAEAKINLARKIVERMGALLPVGRVENIPVEKIHDIGHEAVGLEAPTVQRIVSAELSNCYLRWSKILQHQVNEIDIVVSN